MSSIRCSETTTALLCAVLVLAVAGPASAFAVSDDGVPTESQVGSEVSVTYTIDDPFTDAPDEWELRGSTQLRNVSWTVSVLRQGTQQAEETYGDERFEQDLSIDDGDEVVIELVGDTPPVENYTYDPEQRYVLASLTRVSGSNAQEFRNDTVHHYTEDSAAARTAIEDAQSTIDAAGGHAGASTLLDSAVSSYEAENFENAEDLANEARSEASSARTMRTALMGGGALLVLAVLVGGGYYLWSQRQEDDYSRL